MNSPSRNVLPVQSTYLLLVCCLLFLPRVSLAENCQPSQWGAEDEIGAASHVSPEQVLMAVNLVKKGQTHPLGIVVDPNMPAFPPRSMSLQVVQPGLPNEASAYLASLDPMAVGADTWGLEAVPAVAGDKVFYGHVEFLKKKWIYILETMNTGRLAREKVHEFLFVLGQARIKGSVQMIINPVALW